MQILKELQKCSPRHQLLGGKRLGVPRASGDKPREAAAALADSTCSPRQRG
ncbi:hypothetical protein HCP61_002151 [Salmonella enterica subsp. enterica]|uniref:hypothetical protein n=1 Tax=Salmonella enterica TaxID=28901 RepID=UPI001DAB1D68|nr:hypothetical protein [Salmonella enterica subsp. enterica serovar Grumpensis]EGR9570274.1 hypothetical protein [Salmonella enterica subsp. enterica serovar Grumpensis]